jgi:hypothetical protein
MNISPQHYCRTLEGEQDTVFSTLRETLAHEVASSALLAELLERVNRMQSAQATPERFKEHFDTFVPRVEEYIEVVRPFFPALVDFLPFDSHPR